MRRSIMLVVMMLIGTLLYAQQVSWNVWVSHLRKDAISQGISPKLFDKVFKGLKPGKRHIRLDRTQPEKRLTYLKYRNSRIDAFRIKIGRSRYKKYGRLVNEIGDHYGVDPCIITSIWGIETSYGSFMGSFPVIQSLATLAYDGRRSTFFRRELMYALRIVSEGHISNAKFKGEWAGASGQPQFLPSSFYKFAVDYNKDGKKDIWTNLSDVFASIANYLKGNGWKTGQPIMVQVHAPSSLPKYMAGLRYSQPLSKWKAAGVYARGGNAMPHQNLRASLVEPYGGPDYLVFKNFKVLLKYNNSIYYAGSVSYLADKICRR